MFAIQNEERFEKKNIRGLWLNQHPHQRQQCTDAGLHPHPARVSPVSGVLFCNRPWPLTPPGGAGRGIRVSRWYKRTRRIIWTACHFSSAGLVLMCLRSATSRGAAEGQTTNKSEVLTPPYIHFLLFLTMFFCFFFVFLGVLWWSTTGGHGLPFSPSPCL